MPSLQVRDLPEHIYRKIVDLARIERRSISQETIVLLEKALRMKEQQKTQRKRLLAQIRESNRGEKNRDLPNPVTLIREDRDR